MIVLLKINYAMADDTLLGLNLFGLKILSTPILVILKFINQKKIRRFLTKEFINNKSFIDFNYFGAPDKNLRNIFSIEYTRRLL